MLWAATWELPLPATGLILIYIFFLPLFYLQEVEVKIKLYLVSVTSGSSVMWLVNLPNGAL